MEIIRVLAQRAANLAALHKPGDLIEVYKILNGQTRIDPALFWEVRDARNGARLIKSLAVNGRKQRHDFFSYRVIQRWNLLPVNLKKAPSLDSFKTKLDTMIMSAEGRS